MLEGDKPAICITEPDAGSDALAMTTRADRRGDNYVINGKKHWITGAGVSRLHLIFARVFDERGDDLGIRRVSHHSRPGERAAHRQTRADLGPAWHCRKANSYVKIFEIPGQHGRAAAVRLPPRLR